MGSSFKSCTWQCQSLRAEMVSLPNSACNFKDPRCKPPDLLHTHGRWYNPLLLQPHEQFLISLCKTHVNPTKSLGNQSRNLSRIFIICQGPGFDLLHWKKQRKNVGCRRKGPPGYKRPSTRCVVGRVCWPQMTHRPGIPRGHPRRTSAQKGNEEGKHANKAFPVLV